MTTPCRMQPENEHCVIDNSLNNSKYAKTENLFITIFRNRLNKTLCFQLVKIRISYSVRTPNCLFNEQKEEVSSIFRVVNRYPCTCFNREPKTV